MTAAIFTLQGALILLAVWRGRADRIACVLLMAWIAASMIGPLSGIVERQPAISLIDALIGVGMALLWTAEDDFRAWWIGIIAWAKVAARLAYISNPYIDHWYFAAFLNCALIVQAIIAGGFADAIGHRLDDLLRRFLPRQHRALHYGAR